MKVALFVETYLPYINGVVTHVHSLKTGLEMLGHQVLVVTADPEVKRHTLKDGVLYCPCKKLKRIYGYGLAAPVSRVREKLIDNFAPDIVHVHQEFGIGLFGYQYAKRRKVPMVYTMHTMYDDYLYYVVPKHLIPAAKQVAGRYSRMFVKAAAQVTGPSKKVESYLRSHGIKKPVNVVPNPVELDTFNLEHADMEKVAALREQFGYAADAFVTVFVGRVGKEKNIDQLLDFWAASQLAKEPRLKLMVIGDGPEREALIAKAAALGLSPQVQFIGKVMHDQLLEYLVACDAYVTASLSDTNSISMLEGMAVGLPVFHIHDPLNKGQVVEGVNGFIYNSADELAEKLLAYRDLEDKQPLKESVVESVQHSGAKTLGENLEKIYVKALRS